MDKGRKERNGKERRGEELVSYRKAPTCIISMNDIFQTTEHYRNIHQSGSPSCSEPRDKAKGSEHVEEVDNQVTNHMHRISFLTTTTTSSFKHPKLTKCNAI